VILVGVRGKDRVRAVRQHGFDLGKDAGILLETFGRLPGRRVHQAERPAHIGVGFQDLLKVRNLGVADVCPSRSLFDGSEKLENLGGAFSSDDRLLDRVVGVFDYFGLLGVVLDQCDRILGRIFCIDHQK
jgi:hypothetical protein